jgi:hypothetical protein
MPAIDQSDARRLIDQLERHTRRSRPFLIYGLVAILAGFAILTFHINGLRQHAEAEAAELKVKKQALTARIDQAGRLASRRYAPADAQRALARISDILADASTTTQELGEEPEVAPPVVKAAAHQPDAPVQAAAPVQAPVQSTAPAKQGAAPAAVRPAVIRIFLHIRDKDQYGGAKELQWSLSSATLDGIRIVVPGIEMVDQADDTLRCLKKSDCDRASKVAALVNSRLRGRSLAVRDLSRTYGNAVNVRPGTYEVWLAPGTVAVGAE